MVAILARVAPCWVECVQMSEPKPTRNLITLHQAMERAHFSRTGLYKLLAQGKIRAFKEGTRTLFDGDSIDEYLANLPPFKSRAGTNPHR